MRRAVSNFLFLILTLPTLVSFIPTSSQLPVCCRRDGRHHCSMTSKSEAATQGLSFGDHCPYRTADKASQASSHAVATSRREFAALAEADTVALARANTTSLLVVSSSSLRAPPSVLS
jgi:hypothetical protein